MSPRGCVGVGAEDVGVLPLGAALRALCRRINDDRYAAARDVDAYRAGVFTGHEEDEALRELWERCAQALTELISDALRKRRQLRLFALQLNWDAEQLATNALPYMFERGGARVARMCIKRERLGETYAQNWALQIVQQRAQRELEQLRTCRQYEQKAGERRVLGAPDEFVDSSHASLIAEGIIATLTDEQRAVFRTYSLYEFDDSGRRSGEHVSIRKAAQLLTDTTGESWTFHRVRNGHSQILNLLRAHLPPDRPALVLEVYARVAAGVLSRR